MDSKPEISPLTADAKRQAISPQRGFRYQAWQSVYQWITFENNEILFLEGGEDLDRLKATKATAIQIKETTASITLNSTEVLAAIGHFWEHQSKNRDRKIYFHFLPNRLARLIDYVL